MVVRRALCIAPIVCFVAAAGSIRASADDEALRRQAAAALGKAVEFFRVKVSIQGGYLWRYSSDLSKGEGEGRASLTTAWVQPPGTPTVGQALLAAYRRTGDKKILEAARETAHALVRGQLRSGGWDYRIVFDEPGRQRYDYRVDPPRPKGLNTATLDDNTTQSAVRFLMQIDAELKFADTAIHEAALYALDQLGQVQYPNGAFPQRFSGPPDPKAHPAKPASLPESWPREFPQVDYKGYYTFNDNALADTIDVLFSAARTYEQPRYRAAAIKAADFILLAQLPEPQPAWAQQYDADMHPAWARKFEPPSITGGESQGVIATLLDVYRQTGHRKYLEPIPRAIAYLRRSLLPDGRLARFYELGTNRPLYFTKAYELTYRDDDLPTHYGFKVSSRLDSLDRQYQELQETPLEMLAPRRPENQPERLTSSLRKQAEEIIAAMDQRGAWVENGRLSSYGPDDPTRQVINTSTFCRNIGILARVAGSK
jgi:hypothetical protein